MKYIVTDNMNRPLKLDSFGYGVKECAVVCTHEDATRYGNEADAINRAKAQINLPEGGWKAVPLVPLDQQ